MQVSLEELRQGDSQAWQELYRTVSPGLYRFLLSRVGDASLAEDLMQEGFFRLARNLATIRDARSVKSWLYSTCCRLTADWHRQNSLECTDDSVRPLSSDAADPLAGVIKKESDEEVLRAVLSLSDAHRTVVMLRIWGELSYSEIRDITGLSEGTLRSQFYWAMRKLRHMLKNAPELRKDVSGNE